MYKKSRLHLWLAAAGTMAILAAASGLVVTPAYAKVDCNKKPNHPQCSGGGDDSTDRIGGCVQFTGGNGTVGSDDLGIAGEYCDDDATTDYQNKPDSMQVAMNCKFNHFNLYPGGGSRRIRLDLGVDKFDTAITSCADVDPVEFENTDMAGQDCTNTNPDWAFNQLMRASSSGVNVCELGQGESVDANMRFQTVLHHLRTCKGGKKKCGVSREAIEVVYNDAGSCPPVTITCTETDSPGGQCSTWTVVASGNGCLSHESGGPVQSVDLPFEATFTTTP